MRSATDDPAYNCKWPKSNSYTSLLSLPALQSKQKGKLRVVEYNQFTGKKMHTRSTAQITDYYNLTTFQYIEAIHTLLSASDPIKILISVLLCRIHPLFYTFQATKRQLLFILPFLFHTNPSEMKQSTKWPREIRNALVSALFKGFLAATTHMREPEDHRKTQAAPCATGPALRAATLPWGIAGPATILSRCPSATP